MQDSIPGTAVRPDPSTGEYGDAGPLEVTVRRYVEVDPGEVIDGKLRLTADNARHLAAALTAAANDLDTTSE